MTAVHGGPGGPGRSVRRLIVFVLLFATVTIAAIGLSGLLGRALDVGDELAVRDTAGLAQALAFTLVGGPLAAVLWWFLWRGLADPAERSSVAWGLYIAAMSTVSLIASSTSLLSTATAAIDGQWQPRGLAAGIVWALVWLWHQWMRHHPSKSPTELVDLAPVVGYVFGLILAVGGAVTAIGSVLDAAITGSPDSAIAGSPWWLSALQGLVWAAGGAAIWWWHWFRDHANALRSGLAAVALVIVAALGAVILTLGGLGTILFVLLELVVDRSDPVASILEPLGTAIAAAAVGSLVWVYYRRIATRDPGQIGLATRLVTSGVGLAAAASGIGIIVNSLLAAIGTPIAESGARTLLLAGISSLAVGAPLWWVAWRPAAPVATDAVGSTGRRVYLIAVFGLSAVVALITLLVIGYQIFEYTLGNAGGSLLERIRAPLGLLTATVLVAAYHFAVWRRDAARIAATPGRRRTIGRVLLVTGADPDPVVRAVREASGATVSVWKRAETATTGPTAGQVAAALEGVTGARVLIVTGPGDRLEVIPLAD